MSFVPEPTFTDYEISLLKKTADALTAYLGKPVIAEIDTTEDGMEWVAFGVPLDISDDNSDDIVTLEMGGAGARLVSESSDLENPEEEVYACEFLWGIQITDIENARFVRIDFEGEEVEWGDSLEEMLPFGMREPQAGELVEDEDDENDGNDEDTPPDSPTPPSPTLH
ncbi:hypothetical protein W822_18820 [Advenella kashmirensis W13003]|uniref:Uncharacterized protein n=1 Tax=Advenella kashmirensis W13003 TaxID=1424334 RepID=V8QNS8_9BURK|nr:hypothetical protein [Advenella kashmirensis]ETF01307.1 hypothetical protein W822_18820 [Advenella kashmirensis W13003]